MNYVPGRHLVLAYGEALWDLLPSGPVLGGAPLNFAYRVQSLGLPSVMVSKVGSDDLGDRALHQMKRLGMRADLLQRSGAGGTGGADAAAPVIDPDATVAPTAAVAPPDTAPPTGTVKIEFDENRNPQYEIVEGVAYDFIQYTDELSDAASQAACLCYGTLVQRAPVSRDTLQRLLREDTQALKLCDINLRPKCYSTQIIRDTLAASNALKMNDQEAAYLARLEDVPADDPERLCAVLADTYGLDWIVVTYGDKGAGYYGAVVTGEGRPRTAGRSAAAASEMDPTVVRRSAPPSSHPGDRTWIFEPGYTVEVDDPCGSGDAFTAAFVTTLLSGGTPDQALRRGNAFGALVASQPGATQEIPTTELEEFVRTGPRQQPVPAAELIIDPEKGEEI